MVNKISFKTNIFSDEMMDGLRSDFQPDRRILRMGWKKDSDGYIVNKIEAKMDGEEKKAKFNSVEFRATLYSYAVIMHYKLTGCMQSIAPF